MAVTITAAELSAETAATIDRAERILARCLGHRPQIRRRSSHGVAQRGGDPTRRISGAIRLWDDSR